MKTNGAGNKGINILDILFFIVLIAVILFAVICFTGRIDKNQKILRDNITFSIEITKNDEKLLNYIEEGEIIYEGTTKKTLGEIVAVHEKPARAIAENHSEKTIENVEIPNKIDIVIDISGKADMNYPNISIDSVELKIGKQLDCIIGDAAVRGTVVNMDYDKTLLKKEEASK